MAPRKKVTKLTPHDDGKPRVMHMTKLTAVALTARGANPHADVTFFKSHKGSTETPTEKSGDLVDLLTSSESGHQHGIRVRFYEDGLYLDVGYASGDASDSSHYHSVVIDAAGNFVVSENDGHTHDISAVDVQSFLLGSLNKTFDYLQEHGNVTELEDSLSKTTAFIKLGENQMTVEEQLAKAKLELVALKKTLKTAVKLGGLSDTEKSHHAKLGEEGQETFLGKSHTERNVDIEEALKADPIIYTTTDGVEFRKSDDNRMVDMAKQNDALTKRLDSEVESGAVAKLAKRAETELGNVTGSVEARSAIIKSVDSITDETLRGEAQTTLKAMNAAAAGKFVKKGLGGPSSVTAEGDAESQLDTLAKTYAKDNTMSFAKAYSAVLATPEGEALYNESVA
jgi:hypothetical protein